MCPINSWLYFDLEYMIDMDIDSLIEEEEEKNERTNTTSLSDDSPKPGSEHTR